MSQGDIPIVVTGNLTADPELRFTPSGVAVANFTVASTPRVFDKDTQEWKDGEATFLRCSVWRQQAENVAESFLKGTRVVVQGVIRQRQYEKDGQQRVTYEVQAEEVSASVRWATVKVTKAARGAAGGFSVQGDDPWGGSDQGESASGQPPF